MTYYKKLLCFVIGLATMLGLQCEVFAHPGGHYKKSDYFNTWELADGSTVKGNFSTSVGNILILEQAGGKMVAVPLNKLNVRYRKMAQMQINRIARLNGQFLAENSVPVMQPTQRYSFIIVVLLLGVLLIVSAYLSSKKYKKPVMGFGFGGMGVLVSLLAFKPTATVSSINKTNPSFIDSAFAPYKPSVTTNWDEADFYVASNGIPDHDMMVGITNWQQQVPLPQNYTGSNAWVIPLQPVFALHPLNTKQNFMRGAVAIAVNGVPIFNALNNRGEDSFMIGELDKWGGHCGKGDDYHYHAAPLSLQSKSGLKPIAFCLDGFAVYGEKEPDGQNMQPLDSCHGHGYKNGVYHYHGTKNYPYVIGALRGEVKMDDARLAPENQIMPQAHTSPLRPPTRPLQGTVITDLKKVSANTFLLTYQVNGLPAYIRYSWDDANNYTFENTDVQGIKTTENYVRRSRQTQR